MAIGSRAGPLPVWIRDCICGKYTMVTNAGCSSTDGVLALSERVTIARHRARGCFVVPNGQSPLVWGSMASGDQAICDGAPAAPLEGKVEVAAVSAVQRSENPLAAVTLIDRHEHIGTVGRDCFASFILRAVTPSS